MDLLGLNQLWADGNHNHTTYMGKKIQSVVEMMCILGLNISGLLSHLHCSP